MITYVALLLFTFFCHTATIKVRNHTDQDIDVTIDLVRVGGPIKKTVKVNQRRDINTQGYMWRKISVQTADGKRKGKSGPRNCDTIFYSKFQTYYAECREKKGGTWDGAFFDVFLPTQGSYRKGIENTQIPDTGSNLIITKRIESQKYY